MFWAKLLATLLYFWITKMNKFVKSCVTVHISREIMLYKKTWSKGVTNFLSWRQTKPSSQSFFMMNLLPLVNCIVLKINKTLYYFSCSVKTTDPRDHYPLNPLHWAKFITIKNILFSVCAILISKEFTLPVICLHQLVCWIPRLPCEYNTMLLFYHIWLCNAH